MAARLAAAAAVAACGLAALLALFTRLEGNALAQPTRARVLDAVRADPGCTAGALARALGLDYKTVQHHLRVLRRAGLVRLIPGPQKRFVLEGALPPERAACAIVLRTPSARRVWERVRAAPATPARLAGDLGLAKSTVSTQVQRLVAAGLLVRRPCGDLAARGLD